MNKTAHLLRPSHLKILTTLGLIIASLMATPLKAQNPIPHLVFHVELSGSEAIPAVNTDAKGLITFIFTPDRTKVNVSGMLVKMDGAVTEAKIRLGITGQTGAVLLDFLPLINGRHVIGQLNVTPQLLQNLLINGVYADVRTTAHPNGEIRGQFVCETDQDFSCMLAGSEAEPPNNSTARAFGGIHYPLGAADVVYAFVVHGLSSAIISAGIYEGAVGQTGTLVSKISGFGNILQGLIQLDTVDPDFLLKCREGKYYIVIKTVNFPAGEIRGQVNHIGYFGSLAPINEVQQLPPPFPPSAAFGFSRSILNGTLDSLTTTIYVADILPTSVKIRIGNPNEVGTELLDMGFSTAPGLYAKKYKITAAQLTDFAQGRLFINVTSPTFPNGQIRGVMKNTLRKAYAFDLCGVQVVPPTNSNALGIAVASVDQANCYLNYKLIADGLAGAPVDAYFATAGFGANGTAFHSMPLTEPIIAGSHEIMAALGPIIENSGTYVLISTPGNLSGEIRGQVRRGFTCPEVVVATTELDKIDKVVVSPVPFKNVLNVAFESASDFEGRLVLRDILGVLAGTQSVQIVAGKQSLQLPTANLPKGIYSLSLEIPSQNASVLLKKVLRVE
ncbi:MAG: CHRD domain-containing protein [Phycisphaerae bacterium]|nr:CHRD domain-containing protein [Saprospiraceae bacterium]